ncbi:beta-N-acetylhexosaminidase [Streptomyces litchfieldiae]|uniref:Glycoside hydrolase family 20 protein n=1 Tax=Streptomyces litchfieldiae TaxID=3075543 RepID=A0ABU2N020_9ACTN|nr:glycoside hydrolase family 20 protein [Streptomyces sp. DSM 44938]MDT0347240.1 glycoside hydrolase family 20 protein [Streptomyces sp. DSM 44938]
MRHAPWRIFALAAAVLVITIGAVVAVVQRTEDGPVTERPGAAGQRTATPTPLTTPSPLPTGPSGEVTTIPSVRSFEDAPGPGWAPADSTRVVADPEGPLDDEADRLAEELGAGRAPDGARAGDVELRLSEDADTGDEGYTLRTDDQRVTITARTDAGVFYGTRTLGQAVADRGGTPQGTVTDRPDRPQRGLLLDIARKHFPAEWIEARLHEMAELKLNQLQLHFSDDQGFRLESETHPEIVSETHLTKEEMRGIVELAESLHITVIPEIDSPGHLGAVLKAHPELQLRDARGEPARGAVDISDPAAAELVDDLLREYGDLFPSRYWHLGGDEYAALFSDNPEADYPDLAEAARERHGEDAGVRDLATAWLNDRADTARELGKMPQVWNDGMHAGGVVTPDSERQVAYWTGRELGAREPVEYLEGGWQLINLNSEYLYYVLGEPNQFTYPTGERIYEEWTPDVLRGSTPVPDEHAGADSVPGGRLAVWCDLANAQTTEQVAQGIKLPLAAVAQKLWDPREPELSWAEFTRLADRVAA